MVFSTVHFKMHDPLLTLNLGIKFFVMSCELNGQIKSYLKEYIPIHVFTIGDKNEHKCSLKRTTLE